MLDLEMHGLAAKVRDRHRTTAGLFELGKTAGDRHVCNFDDVDDFSNGATEVVHASSENDARAAQAGRVAPSDHPISFHALDDPSSIFGDLSGLLAEFELVCVLVEEGLDFDDWLDMRMDFEVEGLVELFVYVAQSKHIDVKCVGNVHKEDSVVSISSTGGV